MAARCTPRLVAEFLRRLPRRLFGMEGHSANNGSSATSWPSRLTARFPLVADDASINFEDPSIRLRFSVTRGHLLSVHKTVTKDP